MNFILENIVALGTSFGVAGDLDVSYESLFSLGVYGKAVKSISSCDGKLENAEKARIYSIGQPT